MVSHNDIDEFIKHFIETNGILTNEKYIYGIKDMPMVSGDWRYVYGSGSSGVPPVVSGNRQIMLRPAWEDIYWAAHSYQHQVTENKVAQPKKLGLFGRVWNS